jgi:hypothetical protein
MKETIINVDKERALELIEKIAVFIAKRRMGAPAILFIESVKPLNFLGSQIMHFLSPFANVIFTGTEFDEVAIMFEDRENVEILLKRIDVLDEEMNSKEREQERLKRKKFWSKIKNLFKRKNEKNGN